MYLKKNLGDKSEVSEQETYNLKKRRGDTDFHISFEFKTYQIIFILATLVVHLRMNSIKKWLI